MDQQRLSPVNEILSAIASAELSDADIKKLTNNAHDYFLSSHNMEVPADVKFTVVENTENEINLALPCYEQLEEFHAQAMEDLSMEEVEGGELLFWTVVGILSLIGIAVGGFSISLGLGLSGGEAKERERRGEPPK